MGKIIIVSLLVAALCFSVIGCYTLQHQVGNGAQGSTTVSARQWYILWGLVPINTVDSQAMAAGATNYDVKSQMSFVDVVIGIFTGSVTVYCQTVTVTK